MGNVAGESVGYAYGPPVGNGPMDGIDEGRSLGVPEGCPLCGTLGGEDGSDTHA